MFSVFLRFLVLFFSQEPLIKSCKVKVMKLRPLAIILSSSSQEIEFDKDKYLMPFFLFVLKEGLKNITSKVLNLLTEEMFIHLASK